MNEFLQAIPTAATHPLAMVMYLATIAAWVYVSRRNGTLSILMARITDLPEADRKATISEALHEQVPTSMSSSAFIKHKRNQYFLIGFLSVLATVIILAALTTYYAGPDKNKRAQGFIEQALAEASTDGASARNVIANGPTMLSDAAEEMMNSKPESIGDMQERIDRFRMGNRASNNSDGVMKYLKETSPAAKFQRVNEVLQKAFDKIDQILARTADCYRGDECGKPSEFEALCKYVNTNYAAMTRLNDIARRTQGVMMQYSKGAELMGNGPLDAHFTALTADNLSYLSTKVCKNT